MISHIYRIMKSKLSLFIFIVIILIPCIEIVQLLIDKYQNGTEYHPSFAFFLTGSSRGHMAQIILLWFLPLFFLLQSSDDAIQDHQTGYKNILISKVGRKKYCFEKLITSFSISFLTMFIALFLNFILVSILFSNGTYKRGLDEIVEPDNLLFNLGMGHPYLIIFCFGLVCCIMAGFAGLLGASFSLFFLDKKYAYAATFFIWFLFVLKKQSLMFLFQPFTEYGFDTLVPILLQVLTVFILIPLLIFIYEVKYNED